MFSWTLHVWIMSTAAWLTINKTHVSCLHRSIFIFCLQLKIKTHTRPPYGLLLHCYCKSLKTSSEYKLLLWSDWETLFRIYMFTCTKKQSWIRFINKYIFVLLSIVEHVRLYDVTAHSLIRLADMNKHNLIIKTWRNELSATKHTCPSILSQTSACSSAVSWQEMTSHMFNSDCHERMPDVSQTSLMLFQLLLWHISLSAAFSRKNLRKLNIDIN